ncbi:hypothetical protein [Geothrix sp.]|jgi:hypothetical protein|uniref:hypothetical protein n=1 Tax=Geothrix sp. TaxID=1962974 RepID=UPI0025BC1187|nr:hypothetical protein [Geothrix sp.]
MRRTAPLVGLVLAACLAFRPLSAQEALKLKANELATHPLQANGLSITITGLNGHQLIASITKWAGRAHVKITFENKSSSFQTFSPSDLCFVGGDGVQALPIYEINKADDTTPLTFRIAPAARLSTEYVLTGRLNFPVKIYLGDRLVAQVTE